MYLEAGALNQKNCLSSNGRWWNSRPPRATFQLPRMHPGFDQEVMLVLVVDVDGLWMAG